MKYWPGTNIRKSNNNDFDWNTGESSSIIKSARISESSQRGIQQLIEQRKKEGNVMYATPTNDFVTYSRAKAVRFS